MYRLNNNKMNVKICRFRKQSSNRKRNQIKFEAFIAFCFINV